MRYTVDDAACGHVHETVEGAARCAAAHRVSFGQVWFVGRGAGGRWFRARLTVDERRRGTEAYNQEVARLRLSGSR